MAQNNGSDNYAVTVGTSTVQLVGRDSKANGVTFPRNVVIYNNHATNVLFIGFGASGATSALGLPIPAGGYWAGDLVHYDEVYGVADGAGTNVRVSILHGKGDPS